MTNDGTEVPMSTAAALEQWREAERAAEIAHHGKQAAEAAAAAAESAATAALATAQAAKAALEAATLAELSASQTAASATAALHAMRQDLANAESDAVRAQENEGSAHERYRDAVGRAEQTSR